MNNMNVHRYKNGDKLSPTENFSSAYNNIIEKYNSRRKTS